METQIQALCRICFDVGHFQLNGYEVNILGKNISIDEMIKRFSDIEFSDENTPELICENCTHDLVQSYLFTEKVLEADAKILGLSQIQGQPKLVYEQKLHSEKCEEREVRDVAKQEYLQGHNIVVQEVDSENNEGHSMENQSIENQILEGLFAEEAVIEEVQSDLIEEQSESTIVHDMYIESEVSEDEYEDIKPEEQEVVSSLQIDSSENVYNIPSNYNVFETEEEELIEPRRKYQRRSKTDNEIDKNASFVITQFACSTTAPGMQKNTSAEDTDEVTLSDVRIMNYETVEVKAGNINVIDQTPQSELPIDESRVYLCQYCPRAFSSSAFLVTHVRKTHGCKFCASVFEKAKDLYAHIREAHSKFECVVCGKEFVNNSNMRNHLKIVHKVKVPANVSLISYKKQDDS